MKNAKCKIKGIRHYRPTWAEIDLSAIRHNFLKIKGLVDKQTKILVAVKANAYGHGIIEVSRLLVRSGVDYLGVGTTDEALYLRRSGFTLPILMLGSILPHEAPAIIRNNITQTIGDIALASYMNRYARKANKRLKVHIKVDTGMGRIGVWHKEALTFIKKIVSLRNIEIEGIFSHFSSADEDDVLTRQQIRDFSALIEELEGLNIHIPCKHMANSVAAVHYKDSHMNLIRPGLMVYGLYPSAGMKDLRISLKPVLTLKSRVVFLKDVPPGRRISYGGTYTTTHHTKIATVAIGYGDGLSRQLSNKGSVIIRTKRAPIVGRVCMDTIMVDTKNIPDVKVGDEVVLIGRQGKQEITVEEMAALCDTIPYEVACWFDNRVPRIYI